MQGLNLIFGQMSLQKSVNLEWVTNLRFIALFSVIILHASAVLLTQYNKVPLADWLTADLLNAFVRFSVPVFVMITGALNLGREYEPVDFLKKRLGRIVIPFLFWSLVYILYSWYNGEIDFDNDTQTNIRLVLHQLKYGSSYHLWYIYMLIGLYLFIPVIGKFIRVATQKEITYFLLLWVITMFLEQPYVSRFKPQIDLHYFTGYLGYLVLGYYLSVRTFKTKFLNRFMLLSFVLTGVIITTGTYLLTKYQCKTTTLFYEPLAPFAVWLSISLFLFIKLSVFHLPPAVKQVRDFVGRYAYGIFLCHALVLYLLDLIFHIDYKICMSILSIPLTAVLCLALSTSLIWLINKLPLIGKYVGG